MWTCRDGWDGWSGAHQVAGRRKCRADTRNRHNQTPIVTIGACRVKTCDEKSECPCPAVCRMEVWRTPCSSWLGIRHTSLRCWPGGRQESPGWGQSEDGAQGGELGEQWGRGGQGGRPRDWGERGNTVNVLDTSSTGLLSFPLMSCVAHHIFYKVSTYVYHKQT